METIQLGRLVVRQDGTILPCGPQEAPALRFAWRGRACGAELAADGLRIAADAARIPSTAEPGADRAGAFAALAGLPRRLPPGWRARLTPDHRIRFEASVPMPRPANAIAIVAALVRFVLELDPVLDLLEADGTAWQRRAA
jgi:hypothetical protein